MSQVLVVLRHFEHYEVGDLITDPIAIRTALQGEHAAHVVATTRIHPFPARREEIEE
jgi:hypothetical protein